MLLVQRLAYNWGIFRRQHALICKYFTGRINSYSISLLAPICPKVGQCFEYTLSYLVKCRVKRKLGHWINIRTYLGNTLVRPTQLIDWFLHMMSMADKIAAALLVYHHKKIARNYKQIMHILTAESMFNIHISPSLYIDDDSDDDHDY
jgi:hypothetical protein